MKAASLLLISIIKICNANTFLLTAIYSVKRRTTSSNRFSLLFELFTELTMNLHI